MCSLVTRLFNVFAILMLQKVQHLPSLHVIFFVLRLCVYKKWFLSIKCSENTVIGLLYTIAYKLRIFPTTAIVPLFLRFQIA